MTEHNQGESITAAGVLGPSATGDAPIIVPGGASSSSFYGPSEECTAGSSPELATATTVVDVAGIAAIVELREGETPVKLPPDTGENEMEIATEISNKRRRDEDSGSDDPGMYSLRGRRKKKDRGKKKAIISDTEDEATEDQVDSKILSEDTMKEDQKSEGNDESQCSDGDEAKTAKSKRGPGRPPKRTNRARQMETPELLQILRGTPEKYCPMEYHNMTAAGIGTLVMEWLEEMDGVRVKSGKLQGSLSGKMKNHIIGIKSAVRVLVNKAEASGDPGFWRARHSSINKELQDHKKEENRNKKEIEEANKKIKKLKEELEREKEQSKKHLMEVEEAQKRERVRTPTPITQERSLTPAMRPPIKGVSTPLPEIRHTVEEEISERRSIDMQIAELVQRKRERERERERERDIQE